uniref:PRA1 family protein n=1 Tax=Zea mays TaxID=4577 RepID=C4J508_MAIZE|nr:unknown [Zea mays]
MGAAGAIRRAAASVVDRACAGTRGFRRALARFAPRPSAFGPAADAEAAAVRAVRNLRTFRFHYAVLQWVLLLASLAPRHRASVVFLMAASKGLLVYGGLLKAFPNSALLRRLLDRRLVAAVFVALVLADIVAAGAVANLLAALAAGVPVIVLHASFRVRDDPRGAPRRTRRRRPRTARRTRRRRSSRRRRTATSRRGPRGGPWRRHQDHPNEEFTSNTS